MDISTMIRAAELFARSMKKVQEVENAAHLLRGQEMIDVPTFNQILRDVGERAQQNLQNLSERIGEATL
jgi:hypothetical protein